MLTKVICLAVALLVPLSASARCFDYSQKVVTPLREVPPMEHGAELRQVGKSTAGRIWVAIRSQLTQPISRVLELLKDHRLTKGEADEAIASPIKNDKYLALHDVKFRTRPLPLIDITWKEEWAYALSRGEPEAPEEIVITYEKTTGTNFIEHMCGSIVVRRTGESTTDLFWFEEAKVAQRSAEDTRNTIEGIIKVVRAAN